MLVVLPPTFMVETKLIYGYNFAAPLSNSTYSTYKLKWQIPKLMLRAYTNKFNDLNYISFF